MLFLTNSVALNCSDLKPLYDFFSKSLKILFRSDSFDPVLTTELYFNKQKEIILNFLKAADIKICDFFIRKEPIELKDIKKSISDNFKEHTENKNLNLFKLNITTIHSSVDGNEVKFNLENDESEGTKKLFFLSGIIIDVIKTGKILVIDDLNLSLHPRIMKFIMELFHNPRTNPNNAQLIITTHETSILTQDIFRRDQIWFSQLSSSQETQLIPLIEFKPLKGSSKENLETNYLRGKYGALPFVDLYIFEHEITQSIIDIQNSNTISPKNIEKTSND